MTLAPFTAANGTLVAGGTFGLAFLIAAGASVTYTVQTTAPAAPPAVITVYGGAAGTSYVSEQVNLAPGLSVYATSVVGTVLTRTF